MSFNRLFIDIENDPPADVGGSEIAVFRSFDLNKFLESLEQEDENGVTKKVIALRFDGNNVEAICQKI